MPRRPRSYFPGIPVHVVQRGVNRQPCFFDDADRVLYLRTLGEMCRRYGVDLHAYVLMTNHVHLLMTPTDTTGISRVMQGVGRIYVCRVNQRIGRTGTLWEGRHRDSLIDSDRYLLACQRYIERNPVRAGIVVEPYLYEWSSFRANASGQPPVPLTPHAVYMGLGAEPEARRTVYLRLFELEDPQAEGALREGLARCYPVGSKDFVARLRRQGVRIGMRDRGRPVPDEKVEDDELVGAGVVED